MDSSLHHDPFAPDDGFEPEPWQQQPSGEPVLDYDQGKAKDITVFLEVAPLDVAERVLSYESAHENRKTVVEAAHDRVNLLEEEELARQPIRHSENPETVAAVREALGLPDPDNDTKGDTT